MDEKALCELKAALRILIRSGHLESMSDEAFRQVVTQTSQQLFDKYASAAEKQEQREEQQYDAENREMIYGRPN